MRISVFVQWRLWWSVEVTASWTIAVKKKKTTSSILKIIRRETSNLSRLAPYRHDGCSFDEEEEATPPDRANIRRYFCVAILDNFLLRSTAAVASGMVTWVILKLITSAYALKAIRRQREQNSRGNKRRKRWNWSLEPRAAKTLVYSNDRGLLFGRIPSLNRFTSSALLLLLSFFSFNPIPSPRLCFSFLLRLSVAPSAAYAPSWRHSSFTPQLFLPIFRRVVIRIMRNFADSKMKI